MKCYVSMWLLNIMSIGHHLKQSTQIEILFLHIKAAFSRFSYFWQSPIR